MPVTVMTIEALADRLANALRGLLSANDELGAWLGSFDQYHAARGADAQRWLSLYNAQSLIVDRKTGATKTIFVKRAAVSVTGLITPRALARALGESHLENGLAARIGFAMPQRVRKIWTGAVPEQSVSGTMDRVVARVCWRLDFGKDSNDSPPPIDLALTSEARNKWISYYNDHAEKQASMTGPLAAAYSKLEAIAARLALIVQLVRWATDAAAGEAVDAQSMTNGIAIARWFAHEAERVYSVLGESDEQRDQRRLAEWVDRRGGRATARDVQMGCRWLREPRVVPQVQPKREQCLSLVVCGAGRPVLPIGAR